MENKQPNGSDDVYVDEVGGTHDGAIGWGPDGIWCGECCEETCKDCYIWWQRKADKLI